MRVVWYDRSRIAIGITWKSDWAPERENSLSGQHFQCRETGHTICQLADPLQPCTPHPILPRNYPSTTTTWTRRYEQFCVNRRRKWSRSVSWSKRKSCWSTPKKTYRKLPTCWGSEKAHMSTAFSKNMRTSRRRNFTQFDWISYKSVCCMVITNLFRRFTFASKIDRTMARTMVVTGASSEIGKATAKFFQATGRNVIATMRNPEKETELAAIRKFWYEQAFVPPLGNIIRPFLALFSLPIVFWSSFDRLSIVFLTAKTSP